MDGKKADDKVLGAGGGLLESVVITASMFQEGGAGGWEPGASETSSALFLVLD